MNLIDRLDNLYAQSLSEPLPGKLVSGSLLPALLRVALLASDRLRDPSASGDLKRCLRRICKLAEEEVHNAERKLPSDVLCHWPLLRDLMLACSKGSD